MRPPTARGPVRLAAALACLVALLGEAGCDGVLASASLSAEVTIEVPRLDLLAGAPGGPPVDLPVADSSLLDRYQNHGWRLDSLLPAAGSLWEVAGGASAATSRCASDRAALEQLGSLALWLAVADDPSHPMLLASATLPASLSGCEVGCCQVELAAVDGSDLLALPRPWCAFLEASGERLTHSVALRGELVLRATGSVRYP